MLWAVRWAAVVRVSCLIGVALWCGQRIALQYTPEVCYTLLLASRRIRRSRVGRLLVAVGSLRVHLIRWSVIAACGRSVFVFLLVWLVLVGCHWVFCDCCVFELGGCCGSGCCVLSLKLLCPLTQHRVIGLGWCSSVG